MIGSWEGFLKTKGNFRRVYDGVATRRKGF
jgi:hypothetical protein